MNIEALTEFCLYCKKSLQQGEQYYHNNCHEESNEYKKHFDNYIEVNGQLYWKKDWEIEQKLYSWADKNTGIGIFIDYHSLKDEQSGLDILYVHDLRIINKSTENIPNILFFKGIEYIYLFFKSSENYHIINYTIPKSLLTLKSLKGIWISNIQERTSLTKKRNISSLSGSLEKLTSLERLFLLYEGANFPKGLKNLQRLKEITIGGMYTSNKIHFPKELFDLPNLRHVSCGFIEPVERKEIVQKLKRIKSLENLSFRDNDYNLPKRIMSVNFKLKITQWKDGNRAVQ